ncbi:MAG: cupin domain-containing protein [Alphaproteobacteria bacterium]|jgi:anti-sigma factor ChrR (cupin superfamily)|nr:cupin domain-containing protein [Alphaproteobacteria bacterium]
MSQSNEQRVILRPSEEQFVPYERYGRIVPGISWVNISYDMETGCGSFLLKMAPGCRSLAHEHVDFEDFIVLDGELIDDDGTVFHSGEFVSFKPGSCHWSQTPGGCTIAVFFRQANRLLTDEENAARSG